MAKEPNGKTDLLLVVDRAGSMAKIKSDMEGGLAQFFADQREQPGEVRVTLVQFDTEYQELFTRVPIGSVVDPIIIPRSNTALHDAVGRSVVTLGERLADLPPADQPNTVIVVIITDGWENASREWTAGRVKELVQAQTRDFGWTFVYLGANQDAVLIAEGLGIRPDAALTYTASAGGVAGSLAATLAAVTRTRAGEQFGYDDADRDAAGR